MGRETRRMLKARTYCQKERGLRYCCRENSAPLSKLRLAAAATATAGCVLSSAQLNTFRGPSEVSAVRSQRRVQAEKSVFAGRRAEIGERM